MISNQHIDKRTLSALLYVAQKLKGVGRSKNDMHSVFKALYFADRKHLAEYGRMIIHDKYIAMEDGPVPSLIYDRCKESRAEDQPYCDFFKLKGKWIVDPLKDPDLGELSRSDLECLDSAIEEVKGMNYSDRVTNSHDNAYDSAWSTRHNSPISVIEIAKAGGAHSDIIQYLSDNIG
ncbi:MAG: SocA family protein [Candidatus Cloacimonetes bacterium]|nr:SocA family protein [Candidatus Cloacimonadota bacterium]